MPIQEPVNTPRADTTIRQAHGERRLADPDPGAVANATAAYDTPSPYVADEGGLLDDGGELPRRPRRRLLAPKPLALLGVLLLACGFIAGVLIEKGQTTSGTGTGFSAAATGTHGGAAAAGFARTGSTAGGSTTTESGEVSYVRGATIYLKNSEDNTVEVKAGAGSTVTKTVTTKADKIHPGETVVIDGTKASNGTITAKTITVGSTGLTGGLPTSTGTGATTTKSTGGSESALFGE